MIEDQEFSIEIRKELHRLCIEEDLTDLAHISYFVIGYGRKQRKLNKDDIFYALIDMITYSSRGNMDQAIGNLRLSDQFLRRCTNFLGVNTAEGRELSVQLLFEIWKVHFVATKYYLDCGVLEQEVSFSLLENSINDINFHGHLNLTLYDRREWCKTSITLFQMLSESLNKKMLNTKLIQAQEKGKKN